jgi:RNA polymerase sigma factor (sigma-70 family)
VFKVTITLKMTSKLNIVPRKDRKDDLFNYRLRNARISKGLSIKNLSDLTGIHESMLASYEALRFFPKSAKTQLIAKALDSTESYLFPPYLKKDRKANFRPSITFLDRLPSDAITIEKLIESTLSEDASDKINSVLDTLNKREREIIRSRYGLDTRYSQTLEELGKKFNLCTESIRQIEEKVIKKLQHPSRLRILKKCLKKYQNS